MQKIITPPDGGTLYTETNLANFFPEPLNGITAAFFLIIAVYFHFKIHKNYQSHIFLSFCLVLLYIGVIGGTTYHVFRQWRIFIFMDWVPIMLLCISAGVYFIALRLNWLWAAVIVLAYVVLQFSLRVLFQNNMQFFINVNYATMAALVVLPVLINLIATRWAFGKWVGYAVILFIVALVFRIGDKFGWLEVGTHFLWHTFGAGASFCMLYYIYLSQERKSALQHRDQLLAS